MGNKIYAAFDKVRADDAMKEAALSVLTGRREKKRAMPRALAAACACAVLCIAAGGAWAVSTPVAWVSIDVNPSVELALNRFDRVVSAASYNEDGAVVLDGLSLKGRPCAEAVEALLSCAAMSPYLGGEPSLTVTVASADAGREARLTDGVESCAGYQTCSGQSCHADVDILAEAHGCGMSFGKYAAAQALIDCDGTVTLEDCRSMTMEQIRTRTHGAESGHHGSGLSGETQPAAGTDQPGAGAGAGGNGNGYGQGQGASGGHHGSGHH